MRSRGIFLLWIFILLFGTAFATYSILRHTSRQSTLYDLGIQDQVIWNTAQGRPFESSVEVRNYLADHLSLILAAIAPLFWVWPDVRLLLAVQGLALALGAYPVYQLARKELSDERPALVVALIYLLYPALAFINRFDFHAMALVVPLLLAALWSWRDGRYAAASLWFVLALSCREEVGLAVAGWGVAQAIRSSGQERRLSLQWAVIGLAWSLLGMSLVMPHLRGQPSDTFRRCFGHMGSSYGAGLAQLVRHPLQTLADSWSGLVAVKATFLPKLLLPLAFLPLLTPVWWIPLLPALASAIFSRCLPHSTIYYQYTAPMIPFLVWAGIRGMRRLERFLIQRLDKGARRAFEQRAVGLRTFAPRAILLLLMGLGTLAALAWDWPWWKPIEGEGLYRVGRPQRPDNQTAFREAGRLIPPDAPLAVDNSSGPHFAHRRYLYLFPYGESWRASHVLVDLATISPESEAGQWQLDIIWGLLVYPFHEDWAIPQSEIPSIVPEYLPEGDGPFRAPYGVRYWSQDILLLERGFHPDPSLHQQVLSRVEEVRQGQ